MPRSLEVIQIQKETHDNDMQGNKKEKADQSFNGTLFVFCAVAVIVALGYVSGIRLCSVLSGSMEPNLPTWSLCVVNTKVPYDDIQLGDIVIYNRVSDNLRIIHRVIEILPEGMVTKGDANPVSDGLSVTRDNLYAKYLFHVPHVGYLAQLVTYPLARLAIFACLALLVISDIRDVIRSKNEQEGET